FSSFQKDVGIKTGIIKNDNYSGSNKLIPHFYNHYNYVIHYRILKFTVDLGVKVLKVHKVMSFFQKPWLKTYMDFNTEKRKQAKNEFEKDFLSL
ncbi:MAG: hypothetical protein ACKPKO_23020, partial [Candidatus Fonsibacter sp.]